MSDRSPDGSLVCDYEYELDPTRIARYPSARREESRLLVVPPDGPFRHASFVDVTELFEPGDVLVVNESKVLPVRLLGRKPTGAPSEILLLRPVPGKDDPYLWEALVRPGGKLKPGRTVIVADDLKIEVLDSGPAGGRVVRLLTATTVEAALDRHGHMPLPPYIDRPDEPLDRERYQTVYAKTAGSVAAPTAGLHFTDEILSRLADRGVRTVPVTLHVGIGTFRPIEVDDPAYHRMHRERYEVPDATAAAVNAVRGEGGRVWAVGTTAVRTLESAAEGSGLVAAGAGSTDLFIRPPHAPRVVDGLLTNFHLPRSTLLMLVAALAGYERTMAAYGEAIRDGYRFYSYGDAMAIVPSGGRSGPTA